MDEAAGVSPRVQAVGRLQFLPKKPQFLLKDGICGRNRRQ